MLKLLIGLGLMVSVVVWWLSQSKMPDSTHLKLLTIGHARVWVEIADTPAAITQGLSGREKLPDDQGMLFMFERPGIYSFWMKDMHFPIDIVWIDADWRVVDISSQVDPATFPERFAPKESVQYVLEVNAGKAKEWGIK